jgi:hypothetical protein
MRLSLLASGLVLSLGAVAAQDRTVWRVRDVPPEFRTVVARADLAIIMLHDSVLRELADEMAQGGPDKAIGSCHIDSRLIIHRFGREGISVGRTSDRLRNPTNLPPAWAKQIVTANAGRRAREVDGYAVDLGDKVGVLRPIAQRPICASCHGPADRLSPRVRAVLAERYPADKAIGFSEGEIRGWFWVELPQPAR